MLDYSKLYTILFNAITDACRELQAERPREALKLLQEAQLQTENAYLEAPEEPPSTDYRKIGYIFSSAIEKTLDYLPPIPETSIARYLLQWSLHEAADIFFTTTKPDLESPTEGQEGLADLLHPTLNLQDFAKRIDYDYFDDDSEDLSGIDLTDFFPDDKPRKFRYRYGPRDQEEPDKGE